MKHSVIYNQYPQSCCCFLCANLKLLYPRKESTLVFIPQSGNEVASLQNLVATDHSEYTLPAVPYAKAGENSESLVLQLSPTRVLACNDASRECWTLDLGDNAWKRSADLLFNHRWCLRCHLDFGYARMVLGGVFYPCKTYN